MDTQNNCAVIDGRISVYFEGTATEDNKVETLDTIKGGMENGTLLSAHEALRKLTYIVSDDGVVDDDDGTVITNDDINDDNGSNFDDVWTIGYVSVVILGSTCLFCSIVFARVVVRLPDEYDDRFMIFMAQHATYVKIRLCMLKSKPFFTNTDMLAKIYTY